MRSEVLARVCFLPGNPRRRRRFPAEPRPPRSGLPQRAAESGADSGLRRREPLRAWGSFSFPVSNFAWPASLRAFPLGPLQPPQVRASVGCGAASSPGGGGSGAAAFLCDSPPRLLGLRGKPGCGGLAALVRGGRDRLPCAQCSPPGRRLGEAGAPRLLPFGGSGGRVADLCIV